jgi:S-DNA-T family DNA segregation ATPase FtsK/SpoIIIE
MENNWHSLFFICWLPIFMGALTKGQGVLGGVYGYQIMDYLNAIIGTVGLWTVLAASILCILFLNSIFVQVLSKQN